MPRATQLIPASERQPGGTLIDTLILPYAQRQGIKGFLFGSRGTCVELDLAEPKRLRTDDALVLEDGSLVEIVAEPEPVLELRAPDLPSLAKLAWHLGDRHIPVQILERRLRLRAEPQVEEMLARWGVKATAIEAPFEPEGGAYEAAVAHDHAHHNHAHHEHGHDHHHHDHSHDHAEHAHAHDHHDHTHHDHAHAHAGDCSCGHDHGPAIHQHADEKR